MKPVTDENFQEEVREHLDGPVFVKFYGDWCSPCKAMNPNVEALARDMDGVKFVDCDVTQAPKTVMQLQVRAVPTLMLFSDGMIRNTHVGAIAKKNELRNWISDNI